jgi:hypothetical protein
MPEKSSLTLRGELGEGKKPAIRQLWAEKFVFQRKLASLQE